MPLLSRRARRRRWRMVLVIVAVVVAAEVGAQLLAPVLDPVPIDWPNAMTELKHDQIELLEGNSVDGTNTPVVFAGDSAAQQAFLPATFAAFDDDARLSYNAAVPGGVPGVTRPWLLDQVIPRLEPDVVVWGLGMSDLAVGYGDAQIQAYEGSLGAKEGMLADIERAAAEVSALVHLRPALRDPSLLAGARRDRVVREVEQSESLLGPGGQRLGYEPGPTDVHADDAARLFGDYRVDPLDVADVEDTVDRLRRRGKGVVLVELPTSPAVVDLLPNGARDVSSFREALSEISERTGVSVFRAVGPFGQSDFVDHVHVTEDTAEAITGQVAAALPTLNLAQGGAVFSSGANLERVIAQVDDEEVREQLDELRVNLDAMDLDCNDPAAWMERTTDVRAAMEQAIATIERGDTDDDARFRRSTLARQLSSSIAGRVLLQSGCEPGQRAGAAPNREDFLVRTSELVTTYEHLDAALAPIGETPESPLWMHPDQVFHIEGLRTDAANDRRPDVVFFGASEARTGVDPAQFSDRTGLTAANLGMSRATAEVASLWIDDAIAITRPSTLVWVLSPSELIATCGLEVRRTIYTAPAEVREQLFEALSWAPATSPFERIMGPIEQPGYEAGVVHGTAFAAFEQGTRGTALDIEGTDSDGLERQLDAYAGRVGDGLDCDERFDVLADDVARLVDDGFRLVIVGVPAHPDLLAQHPRSADGVLSAFRRHIDDLEAAGARYIDLTDVLGAEHFNLAVAYNDDGRRILTDQLAEQLAEQLG